MLSGASAIGDIDASHEVVAGGGAHRDCVIASVFRIQLVSFHAAYVLGCELHDAGLGLTLALAIGIGGQEGEEVLQSALELLDDVCLGAE